MNRREFLKSVAVGIGAATVPIVARPADTAIFSSIYSGDSVAQLTVSDPSPYGALVDLRPEGHITKSGRVVGWANLGRDEAYDLGY